jgi:hypothetical protein
LHERLCDLGTHIPSFARGARVFRRFTGTPVCEATLRRYTERAGMALRDHETEAAEAAEAAEVAEAAPGAGAGAEALQPDPPLWVLADGVFVRLRHSEWREVKVLAIGEVQPPKVVKGEAVVECGKLSYFSRLLEVDDFIAAATVEIRRRGVDRADQVGAASDGAPWCQRVFDHHCPHAVRALDFYHAAEYVHRFSHGLYPGGSGLAGWWAGLMLHRLKHEGPAPLLGSLQTWAAVGQGSLGEQAADTLAYFESREALLQYPTLRALGWPIGSGAVESGNKQVVEERMKGPGMFWAEAHVNPMLALRDAACSDRWDAGWHDLTHRMRRGHYPVAMLHAKT